MKNVFAFKIFCMELHKIQNKLTGKESLQQSNIDRFPIAMSYVPWQKFDKMYDDLEKAYNIGTVFPELNKPFTGRRCVS